MAPCDVELKVCQISIWSLHHVMVASYPEARLERMVGKKGCCQASFFGPKNQDGFETFELKTSDTQTLNASLKCAQLRKTCKNETISAKRSLVVV